MILLQSDGGMFSYGNMQLIIIGLMFAVLYFFIMSSSRKKKKEQEVFLEELKKGDQVVTNGGIIGKVTQVEETTVTISLDGKATMKLAKGALSKEYTDSINS